MNIRQAKEQIKNVMTAYFAKDSTGEYLMPTYQQHPVFLMGAPGIGKTAIMEQIASEMGVALLSYSMTHHTRQSALGLPFIVHKSYQGGKVECDVSEYTMSKIIASMHHCGRSRYKSFAPFSERLLSLLKSFRREAFLNRSHRQLLRGKDIG